jgi:hypothetical protein
MWVWMGVFFYGVPPFSLDFIFSFGAICGTVGSSGITHMWIKRHVGEWIEDIFVHDN